MTIQRTSCDNNDFRELAHELEQDLQIRDGDQHLQYAALNKTDRIQHVLVAYKNGKPVGCGAVRIYTDNTMEIKRMFVKPVNRAQGIATAILQALENWSKELGYTHCILETGKNQPEAIALYKKNQYTVIPNFGRYTNSENSICFSKALQQ